MSKLIEVDESNFEEEVQQSKLPVLIDFGAVWCGPCKMLDPIVEELALEWEDTERAGGLSYLRQAGLLLLIWKCSLHIG